jgi:hypothetical protein
MMVGAGIDVASMVPSGGEDRPSLSISSPFGYDQLAGCQSRRGLCSIGVGIFWPLLGHYGLQPLRMLARQEESIRRQIVFLASARYRYRDTVDPREDQIGAVLPGVNVHIK